MRLPGWLVFIVFVPLQIYLFWQLRGEWGWLWTLFILLLLGIVATRSARAPWLTSLFFPARAYRWERRRHVFQGILFLVAAVGWLFHWGPWWLPDAHPWWPAMVTASLVKAAVR